MKVLNGEIKEKLLFQYFQVLSEFQILYCPVVYSLLTSVQWSSFKNDMRILNLSQKKAFLQFKIIFFQSYTPHKLNAA